MIGLRYHTPGNTKQVEVTIPDGETFGGFPGPTTMVVLDTGEDGPLAAAVREALKDGQKVDAAAEPTQPGVPSQVPMWAAQAALKQAGVYDAINAQILSMEASNPPVFFAWTMGNFASRQSAFIATLASQFDMDDAHIDAVFVAADQIAQVAG
ncbi:hypothetical protein [Methylobacterium sp. PvR107]|uniref:hypothetical protein n=1 Tax=Methylobacterium sp. PvR107 TaxID=2806597 RepID=UPI001AE7A65E|nr:hypothetical protein [Methylobacterium sp. PvR107]MBP1179960.1 hypothetical protein [Methylobacterium sp. PvR107]